MIQGQELVSAFEKRILPKSQWTHKSHLIVALWYCIHYDFQTAVGLLRKNIKAYNESIGIINNEKDGYHETLTHFWVWKTILFLENSELYDFIELSNSFFLSNESSKEEPLEYYSNSLLFSIKARKDFVEPDLKKFIIRPKKFLIIEKFYPDRVKDLYDRFDKNGRMLPKGVKYINSWIDEEVRRCYQLMESESIGKIYEWIENWNDVADFEIVSVIDSKKAKRKVLLRP